MQILYLSNRPDVWAETWQHVRHFMGWVDRAVVVTPRRSQQLFTPQDNVEIIADEDISGLGTDALAALDHVRRNVTLRRALIDSSHADDTFLLSDDDYRPMKPIAESFFTGDDGDVGFFSYDLSQWPGDSTDFDRAQHTTDQLLRFGGLPTLSYGSHMPQLMRREIWNDAFSMLDELTDDPMVCEWTLYFNVAVSRHAERMADPAPFQTMCWPQYPNEWPWWVRPREYSFENYYEDLYQPGHLFDGIPSALEPELAERHNFEKLLRWSSFGRRSGRLDFPDDVANPWTADSTMRRTSFRILERARKAYDYMAIGERTALAELAGEVRRLAEEVERLGGRSS